MGFVALATLLTVQSTVAPRDLGVATASNQFARTLGGTVGVGICGSFIATHFANLTDRVKASGLLDGSGATLSESGLGRVEDLLNPVIQAALPEELRQLVHEAVARGVNQVFRAVLAASLLCLICCLILPGDR
ncbi:MAG: MFS transporter [Desulfobacterales bacterium]|nr:MFS transporter [Desulfobacterales bacterium]